MSWETLIAVTLVVLALVSLFDNNDQGGLYA